METQSATSSELKQEMTRPNAASFTTMVLCVSFFAAAATALTTELSLELWAMFIGWTAFSTGAGDTRRGAAAVACLFMGMLLAMGAALTVPFLQSALGALALPLVVFALAAVALLSLLTATFNSVTGYFLGMTAYFASNLPPSVETFLYLGGAALIGAVGAWLSNLGPRLLQAAGKISS